MDIRNDKNTVLKSGITRKNGGVLWGMIDFSDITTI